MQRNLFNMLCCPLCKEDLKLHKDTNNNDTISEGCMVCKSCGKEYQVHDGIPKLYLADDEIISKSDQSKFAEFIITPETLSNKIKNNPPPNRESFLSNKKKGKFFLVCGWLSVFVSFFLLISSRNNSGLIISDRVQLLILISILFFVIDYLIYRRTTKIEYVDNLHKLTGLLKENRLSEYDSRIHIKDNKEEYENKNENEKVFGISKKDIISSTLNKYNFEGRTGLHVGCGGELLHGTSIPYFDKGYNLLGLDISEDYLKEYIKIFNSEGVLANSMLLPFKNGIFDIVNFTDILEHLHHPYLGLCEAQRILRKGGGDYFNYSLSDPCPQICKPVNFSREAYRFIL